MDLKDIDFKNATHQFLVTVPDQLLPDITEFAACQGQDETEFVDMLLIYGFLAWKADTACKAKYDKDEETALKIKETALACAA